jgi:hypothetical protein
MVSLSGVSGAPARNSGWTIAVKEGASDTALSSLAAVELCSVWTILRSVQACGGARPHTFTALAAGG